MRADGRREHIAKSLISSALLALAVILGADIAVSAEAVDPLLDIKTRDLAQALDQRSKELDLRQERMLAEEKRLRDISGEIDRKMGEVAKDRMALEKTLLDIKKASRESMDELASLYEGMSPEDAASSMEKMDNDTALRILKAMKKRQAGKVLGFIAPDRAARLTEEFDRRFVPDKLYEKELAMDKVAK